MTIRDLLARYLEEITPHKRSGSTEAYRGQAPRCCLACVCDPRPEYARSFQADIQETARIGIGYRRLFVVQVHKPGPSMAEIYSPAAIS